MTRQARLFVIRNVISSMEIRNQEQLRKELKKRGFSVTQATLSRDLKDIGVSRGAGKGAIRYDLKPETEVQLLSPLVGAEVLSIHANENLIVVRTLPGCANTVGEFIDVQNHPGIIGTVAGDNTLLVIASSKNRTKQVLRFLQEKLIEGHE